VIARLYSGHQLVKYLCQPGSELVAIADLSTSKTSQQYVHTVDGISGVARILCERGETKLHEIFVAHRMTRNNTVNKVHVAATELPQLVSQNTMCLERQPHKVAVRLCAALISWKSRGRQVPQCPIAGDGIGHAGW